MKRNIIVILSFTFILLSATTGCKKFLDVNENLNDPTKVSISTTLTNAQTNIGNALVIGNGISNELAVYVHQMSTRESPDQYGVTATDFYLGNNWNGLYTAIKNLDVIISQGTEEKNMIYVGIAKILKAYSYSQLVDIYGDVPFSEVDKFKEGIKQTKFDDDAAIYPQLINLLDSGIVDINNTTATNSLKPSNDDLIYKGNTGRWIKAANTIKLKLYTQIRKVQDVKSSVTALLATPANLISSQAESFVLPYGPLGATDDRNPGFGDYTATQRSNHVSPWFYEIMKGYNPNIFTNITDPRIPYYIYNQIKKTATLSQGTEYRDSAFVSIYFGSRGRNRDGNQQNQISLFGIFPVGGRYDDAQGGTASAASGTGAAPYRFVTYTDRLFLEAELINAGIITGDAKATLKAAIESSMAQIDYVITTFVKPTQTVPVLAGTTAVTNYVGRILAAYDLASAEKKMEIIMTQKWLSNVGNAVDQYTDYRRTGYPVMFNPKNPSMAPGGSVQPPINGNPQQVPQEKVPVELSVDYPLSLPWEQGELNLNSNAPAQKNVNTYKVFWQP